MEGLVIKRTEVQILLIWQQFTDYFLAPFYEMAALEMSEDGDSCPWMVQGQHFM